MEPARRLLLNEEDMESMTAGISPDVLRLYWRATLATRSSAKDDIFTGLLHSVHALRISCAGERVRVYVHILWHSS